LIPSRASYRTKDGMGGRDTLIKDSRPNTSSASPEVGALVFIKINASRAVSPMRAPVALKIRNTINLIPELSHAWTLKSCSMG